MIAAMVQARIGSTRLPGKVTRLLAGKPMLEQQLERLKNAKRINSLIVATTELPEDDRVADIAAHVGIGCFRGSSADVLDRYYKGAKESGADIIVRITGDCPLHDPAVVDLVIERFVSSGAEYAKTPENYPEGLDTEVFTFSALETAWKEAKLPSEREHVTLFIRNHPERFKLEVWRNGSFDYSAYHWSVDTENDFQFAEAVYRELYREGETFHMEDVLILIEKRPELLAINKGGTGYEGLQKSLKEDALFKKSS